MERYLYFADGNGANLTTEAATYPASSIAGIAPISTTTTTIWFNVMVGADNVELKDTVRLTHDDTTNTTGHRVKDIAKAIAMAANAGPHTDGVVDVVDLDNSIYLRNLSFVTAIVIERGVISLN